MVSGAHPLAWLKIRGPNAMISGRAGWNDEITIDEITIIVEAQMLLLQTR
jgi:hypothetical protein